MHPFFVILLFLSHFRLNSNSLNINILHPNTENTLGVKTQENDQIPRKFLFISLNSSNSTEKTNNITSKIENLNENSYIFQNPHKYKNESNDITEIKNTILGILTKIKNSFDFTENDQGKRCLLVLMLVIITIVMCCLALQVIISVTKNCKLALNEIAARERKFGMINNEKPSF